MEHKNLGTSGLKVSRIALGCMSFGDTSRGCEGAGGAPVRGAD